VVGSVAETPPAEVADVGLHSLVRSPPLKSTLKQFPAYLNRWDSQQARNEGVFAH